MKCLILLESRFNSLSVLSKLSAVDLWRLPDASPARQFEFACPARRFTGLATCLGRTQDQDLLAILERLNRDEVLFTHGFDYKFNNLRFKNPQKK